MAREVFEAHTSTRFHAIAAQHGTRSLGDLAAFRNGLNFTKQSKGQSIRILGVADFKDHDWAPMDSLDEAILDGVLAEEDKLRVDDIVVVRSNGNPALIGRSMLIAPHDEVASHSGFTIRVRTTSAQILPEYLCRYLKSGAARELMIAGGTGTSIRSLNQGTLGALEVPLPPVATQKLHVDGIRELKAEASRLEDVYRRKLTALDELRTSLLHQAFHGDL